MYFGGYVGVYWGDRPETPVQLAGRWIAMADALTACGMPWPQWWDDRWKPMALERTRLAAYIARGLNRNDVGEVIEDLGFSQDGWVGDGDDRGYWLTVHAGSYAGPGIVNSAVLSAWSEADDEWLRGAGRDVLTAMVRVWDPDYGLLIDSDVAMEIDEVVESRRSQLNRNPELGWLTWVSGVVDVSVPGVTCSPLLGGTLLDTTSGGEFLDGERLAPLALAVAKQAGWLDR